MNVNQSNKNKHKSPQDIFLEIALIGSKQQSLYLVRWGLSITVTFYCHWHAWASDNFNFVFTAMHCTLGQLKGSRGHTAKEVWKVSKLTQIVFWVLFEATMHGISTILHFPTLIWTCFPLFIVLRLTNTQTKLVLGPT